LCAIRAERDHPVETGAGSAGRGRRWNAGELGLVTGWHQRRGSGTANSRFPEALSHHLFLQQATPPNQFTLHELFRLLSDLRNRSVSFAGEYPGCWRLKPQTYLLAKQENVLCAN